MPITRAYEEVIDFIAAGARPEDVVAFRPSTEAKARVADLIHREKTTGLPAEETAELLGRKIDTPEIAVSSSTKQ